MLYQILIASSFTILVLVCVQSYRVSASDARYAMVSLYTCALAFVLSGMYPAGDQGSPLWLASVNVLALALLFPILFLNIKHYTTLSLPQWQALRAFSLGIPLLLGLDGVVDEVLLLNGDASKFPPYIWTAYCFAFFCILTAAWRFTTTPRQRGPILLLALVPSVIVAADLGFRLGGWLFVGRNPSFSVTLVCVIFMSVLLLRHNQFNVRPVARSALIDQVRDILLVIDPNHRISDCNQAATCWFGQSEKVLIGSEMRDWLPNDLSRLLEDEVAQNVVVPWPKNYEEYWFEVTSADLLIDRRVHGKMVTLRDVSKRRRVEMALSKSRQELELANAKLQELANTDSLTGLYNRRFLMQRLSTEIERHRRSGLTLGLLMLDLDHFKKINDQYGHPVGDLVLQQAAKCMQQTVRESDVVGRIGGEEFAIIAVDAKDEGPFALANRLKENLASLKVNTDDGRVVSFTASIGCVHFTGGVIDANALINLADRALYTSKNGGRNRVTNTIYADRPKLISKI